MTDRHSHFTVILGEDIRDDDLHKITDAVSLMKGVLTIELGEPVDMAEVVGRARAARRIGELVLKVMYSPDSLDQAAE